MEEPVLLPEEAQELKLPQETRDASENVVPDENLRMAINKEFGLINSTAYITQEQMETVTEVHASNYDIHSLEGMGYATNLTVLDLQRNPHIGSDLVYIKDLNKLEELYLTYSNVVSVEHLKGLTNLRRLGLGYNPFLYSIGSLSDLTKLEELFLRKTLVNDLSALKGKTSLTYLDAGETRIGNSTLKDVTPTLTELNTLMLDGTKVQGLDFLKNSTNDWTVLVLNDCQVTTEDLKNLENFTTLKELSLGFNQIDSVESLRNLKNLDYLWLGSNRIYDFSPLKELKSGIISAPGQSAVFIVDSKPFTSMVKDQDGNTIPLTPKYGEGGVDNGDGTYTYTGTGATFNFSASPVSGKVYVTDGFFIEATAGSHGTISPEGTVGVPTGADKTFTFTPDSGYEIDKILVDNVEEEISDSYTFTDVTEAHTVEVTFKEETTDHTITATAGENGSITPEGTVIVTHGSDQEFQITPDAGYKIKDVTVDGVSQGAPKILILQNVMGDQTVEATFEEDPVSVTSGGDQSMVEGSDTIEDIKLSGALEDFEGLWIDGTQLTQGTDYTAKSGSTIVTFASSYLKKLPKGTHNLEFHYTGDRVAKTTLMVTAKEENNGNGNGSGTTNNGFQGTSSGGSAGTVHGVNSKDGSANTGDHYPVAILLLAFLSMTVVVGLRKSQKN